MLNIILIVRLVAPLTKLSAAVVQRPSNSDHMGIWLTAGQVLHRNLLIDLKRGQIGSKTRSIKSSARQQQEGAALQVFLTIIGREIS